MGGGGGGRDLYTSDASLPFSIVVYFPTPPSELPPSRPYTGDVLSCLLLPVCLSPFLPGEDQNQREKRRGIYSLEKNECASTVFSAHGMASSKSFRGIGD